jgi:serine/threonine protein kinase
MRFTVGDRVERFLVEEVIRVSAYYESYKVSTIEGMPFVLKCVSEEKIQNTLERMLLEEEGAMLASIGHPCIRMCREVLPDVGAQILEYVDGNSLDSLLYSLRTQKNFMPAGLACYVATCLARALVFLHGQGIWHLDVSPSNVLVGKQGQVLLCDFEHGRWGGQHCVRPFLPFDAKKRYSTPEQNKGEEPSDKTDVFQYGALLSELLEILDAPSPVLQQISQKAMLREPGDRPSMQDLLVILEQK